MGAVVALESCLEFSEYYPILVFRVASGLVDLSNQAGLHRHPVPHIILPLAAAQVNEHGRLLPAVGKGPESGLVGVRGPT